VGGQLGRPSGARFRTYERLKAYAEDVKGTLFATPDLLRTIEDIYKYPLLQSATDTLNRQLKSGIPDQVLADLVVSLRADARLCRVSEDIESSEPQVICSLGLRWPTDAPSATDSAEAAIFTLVFEKGTGEDFTEAEKKICSEEGLAALLKSLKQIIPNYPLKIEVVCEGSGPGSYWQEYSIYVIGFLTITGGLGNALFMFGEALDALGQQLGQHLPTVGKWFKGTGYRLTPKLSEASPKPKHPGCFGSKRWLDRRTKRCNQCGFLAECLGQIKG
jgi:hypothetical protein